MRRSALLALAAAVLLALAAGALVRSARTPQPAAAERETVSERASPASAAVAREAVKATQDRADLAGRSEAAGHAAELPPATGYREQLASAKRAFASEARDGEWAAQAETQLRAAIESGQAARPVQGAAGRDLQVECRTRHCRLSVPIPPGQGIASLPVAAEMADTLQRAASAIAALGRIVGENAEPSDPRQPRRYTLYLRRHDPARSGEVVRPHR